MSKYVRVIDGLKSNANGFTYKLNEINIANIWNPNGDDTKEFGGFNFSSEDKILRWIHRGDTLYDVIIPEGAEAILCNAEKGIYRTNRIIIMNPRTITDELVMDLYKNTTLSNKVLSQCLETLLWKGRIEISKYIIKDRVNQKNVNEFIFEFEKYVGKENFKYEKLNNDEKEIYDMLRKIKGDKNESF